MDNLQKILSLQKKLREAIGNGKDFIEALNEQQKGEHIYHLIQALRQELSEAQDALYWKWWSKEGKDSSKKFTFKNKENLMIEFTDTLFFLLDCFSILNMDSDKIFRLYYDKWQINMDRQKNNYSVDTKTEEDNIKLENEIRKGDKL